MRKLIRSHLLFFSKRMPDDFDLRGASIGNLILAGGYFNYQRRIDPVIYLFSKLVEVHGTVRPVCSSDLHLAADLEDGSTVVGQHLLTGKEAPPIASPIKRLFLVDPHAGNKEVVPKIRSKIDETIRGAELICFPMGSFYSSIVACLLPRGVGQAVSATDCPKIYIPNSGPDPEQLGMSLFQSVTTLIHYLQKGCERESARDKLLNFVLLDSKNGHYPFPLELNKVSRYGVEVLDVELITPESTPFLDHRRVIEHLLSLV